MIFVDALGNNYHPKNWLTFNDVLLRPQKSKFKSRNDKDISLSCRITENLSLDVPIISANMDTVTGDKMAIEMHKLGGLGILHRFYGCKEDYLNAIHTVFSSCGRVAFSVGCGETWIRFAEEVTNKYESKNSAKIIVCLDVANGCMEQSIESVEKLSKLNIVVIAGNVATGLGALDLVAAGAKAVKVGVGNGSVCSTRIVTGHGVPQLSAIMEIKQVLNSKNYHNIGLIADGGVRNSGDIIKALAAGADSVMIGNLLAGCDETPGEFLREPRCEISQNYYKVYRGQSSRSFLEYIGKTGVSSEGESIEIKAKGSTESVVREILGGIRSGLTYSGAGDIYSLQEKSIFMEISRHSWIEGTPHAFN